MYASSGAGAPAAASRTSTTDAAGLGSTGGRGASLIARAVSSHHERRQPRRQVPALHRAVVAEDRRRSERSARQGGQAQGRVRLAPPRDRGRALPGGRRTVADAAPRRQPRRRPRRVHRRAARRRALPACADRRGPRRPPRAEVHAEHRQRDERADGSEPRGDLTSTGSYRGRPTTATTAPTRRDTPSASPRGPCDTPKRATTSRSEGTTTTSCPRNPEAKNESRGMPQRRRRAAPSLEPRLVQNPAP